MNSLSQILLLKMVWEILIYSRQTVHKINAVQEEEEEEEKTEAEESDNAV